MFRNIKVKFINQKLLKFMLEVDICFTFYLYWLNEKWKV